MNCPLCESENTRVRDTTPLDDVVARRHACKDCGARWSSQQTLVESSIRDASGDRATRRKKGLPPPAHVPVDASTPTATGLGGVGGGLSPDPFPDSGSGSGISSRSDPPARSPGAVVLPLAQAKPPRETLEKIQAGEFDRLPYPMACITPEFEEVYAAYPRGHAKNEAAKIFHYLAMVEGGQRALADKILVAFSRGLLLQAPYTGPTSTCPMLSTFLTRRSWADKVGGAKIPKRSALGEMPD